MSDGVAVTETDLEGAVCPSCGGRSMVMGWRVILSSGRRQAWESCPCGYRLPCGVGPDNRFDTEARVRERVQGARQ